MKIESKMQKKILDFFIKSDDFNGIPLRDISKKLNIDLISTIDTLQKLVQEDKITLQFGDNPHIIRLTHYPIEDQLHILENVKNTEPECVKKSFYLIAMNYVFMLKKTQFVFIHLQVN